MNHLERMNWAQKRSIYHRDKCRDAIDLQEAREHRQKADRFEREAAAIKSREFT